MAVVLCSPFVLALFLVARFFNREGMRVLACIALLLAAALVMFAVQADVELFRELWRKASPLFS